MMVAAHENQLDSAMQAAVRNRRPQTETPSLWQRARIPAVIVTVTGLIVAGLAWYLFSGDNSPPPRQVRELSVVRIIPPPPPPPTPPPPEQPKMIAQPKMLTPEIKQPDKPDDKPLEKPKLADAKNDAPPPGPLALDAKAEGPGDLFGLAGKPGGEGLLGGGGGGGGSRWGWYASEVQNAIQQAFDSNAKTRISVMQIEVRVWLNPSGRVTRVVLSNSTGDPEVDAALRDSVLPSISLRDPPPSDMPMPIVVRMTARRPT
jgi:protein TonB